MSFAQAIVTGDLDAVRQHVQDNPDVLNAPIAEGIKDMPNTELLYYVVGLPFHDVLAREKAIALLKLLVNQYEMDVNKRNINGETPLHGSVSYGEAEMSRILLDAGAVRDARGGIIEDGTPLLLATFFSMLDCANLLVDDYDAPLDNIGIAAGMGRSQIVSELLVTTSETAQLNRALSLAAMNNQVETAKLVLEAGADITNTYFNQITPLHWAATRNHATMAQWLLDKNADTTVRDAQHNATPLQWAKYNNSDSVISLLDG